MKKYILLFTFLISFNLFASTSKAKNCKLSSFKALNHSVSLEKKIKFAYQDEGEILNKIPGLLINECKDAGLGRKYLLLGHGPTIYGTQSTDVSATYGDELKVNQCEIENSGFPSNTQTMKKSRFAEQKRFLNKCVTGRIRQWSSEKLNYRKEQENCKITKKDDQTAFFKGGACFFLIQPDSEYVVTYDIDKKCTEGNYLKSQNIEAQEINTLVSVNVAGDDSGLSYDLSLIGTRPVNFTIEPTSKMLPISDDWGINVPQVPARFEVPDVQMKGMQITDFAGTIGVRPSWVVNNVCEKKNCSDGHCTSSCNYSKPLFGEIVLYEIGKKGNKEYLFSWFEGGIIPPNWQGEFIPQIRNFTNLSFQAGKKYILEVEFIDPKFDFAQYSKTVSSFFKPIIGIPNNNFAVNLKSGIPLMKDIVNLTLIQNINLINDYNGSNTIGDFIEGEGINTMSNFTYWPPIYEKICLASSAKCLTVGNKSYLTLGMEFEIDEDNMGDDFDLALKNIRTYRNSKILDNINTHLTPEVICK